MAMDGGKGMSLARALRVERGAVVSFVGGGGKTTSMFRLAAELSAAGLRVVTTTTTHISKQQVHMAPVSLEVDEIDLLDSRLDRHGQCLVIGPSDGKGRVFGASSELIGALHARRDVDVILVEADGSRSLPFKAPGQHEPVVPEVTTILSPIAGINALGQPLDEAHVHRSELVASLAQQPLGSPITATTLARVLSHPQGGGKLCPAGARLVPILNKIDADDFLPPANEAAAAMLSTADVDTVILSSLKTDPPVRQSWTRAAGIVLAACKSTHGGESKQSLPWDGETAAVRAARIALEAGLDPVIVVLRGEEETIGKSLVGLPIRTVFIADLEAGHGSSVRKGLESLPPSTGAAVFLFADQPLPAPNTIESVLLAHRQSFAPACVPVVGGRRGNSVLFDRALFRELAGSSVDAGARELLEKYASAVVTVPPSP